MKLPGDIKFEEWDSWHTLIVTDELSRVVSTEFLNCKRSLIMTRSRHIPVYYGALEEVIALGFPLLLILGQNNRKPDFYLVLQMAV